MRNENFLEIRRACIAQIKSPSGAQLPPDVVQEIKNAENLDDLLDILTVTEYWNWLDLRLLEALVVASGSSTALNILKKYKEIVYPKKLIDVLPIAPSKEIRDAYFTKVVSIIGKNPNETTVADLIKFRSKLESVIMDIINGSCVLEHIPNIPEPPISAGIQLVICILVICTYVTLSHLRSKECAVLQISCTPPHSAL